MQAEVRWRSSLCPERAHESESEVRQLLQPKEALGVRGRYPLNPKPSEGAQALNPKSRP